MVASQQQNDIGDVPEPREPRSGSEPKSPGDPAKPPGAWGYRLAVLRHYRPVFGYAATILGAGADAEDVTQETFLRYLQFGGEVRELRAWLLRVARNLSLDRLRAGGRTTALDEAALDSIGDAEAPDEQASRLESAGRLRRLITELPEPQRSLVVLFDMQGMSGAECAQILGISVNQVKVYLHRGRRRLRQRLEESND